MRILLTILVIVSLLQPLHAGYFCGDGTFTARCQQNEVIIMENAHLRVAHQCDPGGHPLVVNTNCSVNVLGALDVKCSASEFCSVPVSSLLNSSNQCESAKGELFLSVSYRCVKPILRSSKDCQVPWNLATNTVGYLASTSGNKPLQKALACPWKLKASPGRQINLTLWDFASSLMDSNSTICKEYAYLRMAEGTELTVCGSFMRKRHIILTKGNQLDVYLISPRQDSAGFILQYEEVGCPNILHSSKYEVISKNGSTATILCHSGERILLECIEHQWIDIGGQCNRSVSVQALLLPLLILILVTLDLLMWYCDFCCHFSKQ